MKDRLHVTTVLDQSIYSGGGYQQALNAINLVESIDKDLICHTVLTFDRKNLIPLKDIDVDAIYVPLRRDMRLLLAIRRHLRWYPIYRYVRLLIGPNCLERALDRLATDLVYFISPCELALDLDRINFIFTVWDLCHRDHPEFPEVRYDGQFEYRERILNSALPMATAIIVDSPITRNRVIDYYRVDPARVSVFSFSPALHLNKPDSINKPYDYSPALGEIATPYIFYPAQFWPHKNHKYILEALKVLEDTYFIRMSAVFAGGSINQSTYKALLVIANHLSISDRIHFLGFVPNHHLHFLYKHAVALVMPTYFGPTNLPPLEAFSIGTPVVYPDLKGLRDQVAESALLVDLNDPDDLAAKLYMLSTRPEVSRDLVLKGKKRLNYLLRHDSQREALTRIFIEFKHKKETWC